MMIHRVQRFVPPRLRAVGVEVNGSNGCVTRLLTRAAIPWGDRKAAICTAITAGFFGASARRYRQAPFCLASEDAHPDHPTLPAQSRILGRCSRCAILGRRSRSMPLGAASVGAAAPRFLRNSYGGGILFLIPRLWPGASCHKKSPRITNVSLNRLSTPTSQT